MMYFKGFVAITMTLLMALYVRRRAHTAASLSYLVETSVRRRKVRTARKAAIVTACAVALCCWNGLRTLAVLVSFTEEGEPELFAICAIILVAMMSCNLYKKLFSFRYQQRKARIEHWERRLSKKKRDSIEEELSFVWMLMRRTSGKRNLPVVLYEGRAITL